MTSIDAKFRPGRAFVEPELRLPGSCRARSKRSQCIMYCLPSLEWCSKDPRWARYLAWLFDIFFFTSSDELTNSGTPCSCRGYWHCVSSNEIPHFLPAAACSGRRRCLRGGRVLLPATPGGGAPRRPARAALLRLARPARLRRQSPAAAERPQREARHTHTRRAENAVCARSGSSAPVSDRGGSQAE